MRATESAINTLIEAQQKCEDMYINDTDKPKIHLLNPEHTPDDSNE